LWQNVNRIIEGVCLVDVGCLLDNIGREVGDGSPVLFQRDPWLNGSSLNTRFISLYDLVENKLANVGDMFSLGYRVNSIMRL
jgi:hypothetical protein